MPQVLGGVCRVCVCHAAVCPSQDTHDARAQRPPSDVTSDPQIARSVSLTVCSWFWTVGPCRAPGCSSTLPSSPLEGVWGGEQGLGVLRWERRRLGEQPEASERPYGREAGGRKLLTLPLPRARRRLDARRGHTVITGYYILWGPRLLREKTLQLSTS